MKGRESRDRERKKEIKDLFNPRNNGVFIYRSQGKKIKSKYDERPRKVKTS